MRFTILTIGKTKSKFFREGIAHYIEAIQHFTKVEYMELKDVASDLTKEGAGLWQALEKRGLSRGGKTKIYVLDERGKAWASTDFAAELQKHAEQGAQDFVFLLGGAYGFDPDFLAKLDKFTRLSLSPMTFPHELARVILCEQIYRALHIQSGTKYHHS